MSNNVPWVILKEAHIRFLPGHWIGARVYDSETLDGKQWRVIKGYDGITIYELRLGPFSTSKYST